MDRGVCGGVETFVVEFDDFVDPRDAGGLGTLEGRRHMIRTEFDK